MGWYGARISENQSLVQFFEEELAVDILAWNIAQDVFYAAVKHKGSGHVFGLVIPHEYVNGMLMFKPMGEELGPYEYGASHEVLDLLSPPVNEYAKQWREMCYDCLHEVV